MQNTIDTNTAILILACAGAINRDYLKLIELMNVQVQTLNRILGKRPRCTDIERARMARLANEIDKQVLSLAETIVTPQTMHRWYRQLIARKYDGSAKRGRPRVDRDTEDLIVQLAQENPSWGEVAISDRLKNLHIEVSPRTVGRILQRNGIPPSSERLRTGDWDRFLKTNWPDIAAMDFTTIEVLQSDGHLVRHHAWYAMHLKTREVQLVDITDQPTGDWTTNMARRLTDFEDGFLRDKRFAIMDRDTLYCTQFRTALSSTGVKPVRLPPRSPNLNAYMERFIGTVRREICSELIPRSTEQLRQALTEHAQHYNRERNHQGLDGHAVPKPDERLSYTGPGIVRSMRLGGLLNFYHRSAVRALM
jgi:putative transposase